VSAGAVKRIAILMHERDSTRTLYTYQIGTLARFWMADGHRVHVLFGTSRFIAADIVIVHVDLSVVPESYMEFARRYPIALNARLRDIRKSAFATNLLKQGDSYAGPAIVKADLNFRGIPEFQRGETQRAPEDGPPYHIYPDARRVPPQLFGREDLVVQKFEPEMDGKLYCVRYMAVMGSYVQCMRLRSTQPVVNGETCLPDFESVEPHPDILAARERHGLDYGKIDYVVVDGRAILFDLNKTVGVGNMSTDPAMLALRQQRARGLYSYFEAR
jgi:hypothetical protein